MKRAALLLMLCCPLFAQSPSVDILHYRTASLCTEGDCLTTATEVRMLRISADTLSPTAYQVHIITPGADGSRRTWTYIIARDERRYGDFAARTSATFFVVPIDLDIPILDVWVTALVVSGEPYHHTASSR